MPSIAVPGRTLPPRLRFHVLATVLVGLPVVAAAAASAIASRSSTEALIGIALFSCFALLAELRPVPVDTGGKRDVSLAFVFVISVQVLFGWQWSVLAGSAGIALAMALGRSAPLKVLFNAAVYAIAAGVAALCGTVVGPAVSGWGYGGLVASTVVCGAVFLAVNIFLVCLAIALGGGLPVRATFVDYVAQAGAICALMVFVAAQAVILWRDEAGLVLLLTAPLLALWLYQRTYLRSRVAEQEAATDSLTCLRNRRAFEDAASHAMTIDPAGMLSLCLLDIDHFKQVNDRHGHPTGDAVLELLGSVIDECAPNCGYRLGGDELAFMLEADSQTAAATAERVRAVFAGRSARLLPEPITVSAGIASYPRDADDLHSLLKHADLALYQSKNNGRSRTTIFTSPANGDDADGPGGGIRLPDIRLVIARRLVTLVDALAVASADARGVLEERRYTEVLDHWQSFDGEHSEAVASLAVALGRRLGLSREDLDDVRLAALLHDVGKIAVPPSILSKPSSLTTDERSLIERHAMIGYELLRDLGLAPVDEYVLHHHERWDGTGYPGGLAGAEIPFGSRLILVADAFDALTSDRSYRNRVSVEAAMHELEGEAGRQFDPLIVATLRDHLANPETAASESKAEREPAWSF
jgi:diguanylate cyclase (GGDEF)-like protein/putative nucleotidyltransferase with HDIG domain